MASIARCMRVARPSAFSSALRQTVLPTQRFAAARAFSVTAICPVRKYTRDHEWIDLSADNKTGVIGISEYAAEALGDVVYVELPEDGKEVAAGDAIGAVESVKSAADINAPISCSITHVNLELEEKPATINKVPEDDSAGGGWIAKVKVDEAGVKEFEALMSADEYKKFTAESDH
ncbi:glycine cleavage system H-protein subunit [Gnomoniopsis smithogilvyi]|uniref:Glycine cleavage system H protein n=1 Tax=Gnomoniopsis smithogilvyi TaxID=1191159 RepID=A0A9W8YRF6_9PEZI|nr:glycine cleavage system H-protein subunit [Gnomoniopsis smithogilvyi]